ncbi:hypothetical protein [Paenibacillus flagellatus]|nr:hypothetical protein [Paenibacillus flagellatus]
MYRWLLAVSAVLLGAGVMLGSGAESAALQREMETHTRNDVPSVVRAAVVAPDGSEASGTFEAEVDSWIKTLSAQDEFKEWEGARWTRHPLGPGMHGWLVLVHKNGKEIGYLVVGATEDGKLRLTEYGAGDRPLFGMQTLYRSLIQLGLIDAHSDLMSFWQASPLPPERVYYSPLHAVWKLAHGNEWLYIDAKTGERLPLGEQSFEPLVRYESPNAIPEPSARTARSLTLPEFDPFDNTSWITGPPAPFAAADELFAALTPGNAPVTYKANLYGKTVLAPYAVTGYQDWGLGVPYVRLEQEGARYVPYDVLKEYGGFHQTGNASSS